jgi:dolichyl-diphosphooligosaccharide---protein glycosyltransferase
MVRLVLLTAPIGSVLGGIAAGRIFAWCVQQWSESDIVDTKVPRTTSNGSTSTSNDDYDTSNGTKGKDGKKRKNPRKNAPAAPAKTRSKGTGTSFDGILSLKHAVETASNSREGLLVRRTLTVVVLLLAYTVGNNFTKYCWRLSKDLSNPSIILQGRLKDGSVVTVDDYREAYWWLRDNTPEDARIMAWWDYGYQITGMFVHLLYGCGKKLMGHDAKLFRQNLSFFLPSYLQGSATAPLSPMAIHGITNVSLSRPHCPFVVVHAKWC